MNIPDEVLEAAAKAGYEQKMKAPWDRGFSSVKDLHRQEAAAIAPVIAEWARKEALREAAERVRDYWDACGELIDSNNGARLAFDAVAEQIAEVSS